LFQAIKAGNVLLIIVGLEFSLYDSLLLMQPSSSIYGKIANHKFTLNSLGGIGGRTCVN